MIRLMTELWAYARARRKYFLIPLLLLFLLFGLLLVIAETSAVAPFIYTLF